MTFEQGNALINPNTICSNDFELAAYLQMFTIIVNSLKRQMLQWTPLEAESGESKFTKALKKTPIT